IRGNCGSAASGNAHHHVKFVRTLLNVSGCAGLQPERKNRAVARSLCFDIGKTTAADGFSAWHVSRGNLYVETIAAPISFIVVERLIGTYRYARSFRRIAGAQRRDVCALRSWLRRRPDDLALRRDWRSGQQKCERQSQN